MYHDATDSEDARDAVNEETPEMHKASPSSLVELIKPGDDPTSDGTEPGIEDAEMAPEKESDFVAFYRLKENPFSDSVNPRYFYKTDNHEETYIRMMLAIRHTISLGLVTGTSGTGKTLVSQMILQNLDPAEYQAVLLLVSPGMSKTGLLREILSELDIELRSGPVMRTDELVKTLGDYVIDLYERGRRLVLLIDECHFLSSDSLHIVRTLSNIEIPERKLLTCLLFGESRFLQRLAHPSYESLRNRMYLRGELQPLRFEECEQYIKFRLLVAGRNEELFDRGALEAVHAQAAGICRRINKVCMLSLLEGFLRRRSRIDRGIVEHCAKQL